MISLSGLQGFGLEKSYSTFDWIYIIVNVVLLVCSLAFASMETGVAGLGGTAVGYLEQCDCPTGYKGLSCELCDFGFARILSEDADGRQHAVCSKCNCNGHAETCHPVTGQCGVSALTVVLLTLSSRNNYNLI